LVSNDWEIICKEGDCGLIEGTTPAFEWGQKLEDTECNVLERISTDRILRMFAFVCHLDRVHCSVNLKMRG
jgi:hypothetical protein